MMRQVAAKTLRGVKTPLFILATFSAAAMMLAISSPWLMRSFVTNTKFDWVTLGNAGQAFGAAAAILTALALGGVAASLFIQIRDSQTAQEQIRVYQLELMRIGLDHPEVAWYRGMSGADTALERRLQMQHINLWIMYWRSQYAIGGMTLSELDHQVRTLLFSSEIGREFWREGRNIYFLSYKLKRDYRFFKTIDQAYLSALESGAPEFGYANTDPHQVRTTSSKRVTLDVAIPAAALLASIAAWMVHRTIKKELN